MRPNELARIRREELGLTQLQLAEKLKTTRVTIARYETGARRIPGVVELMVKELSRAPALPMVGIVAAGKPIEPVTQNETVEVPFSMIQGNENFVLKINGESMRDDGILPGDLVVVRKQSTARTGDRVIGLINGQATIKKYYRKSNAVELRPVNSSMDPIVIKQTDDFHIQGVVVGLIRHYK
jgi:repressor LexA